MPNIRPRLFNTRAYFDTSDPKRRPAGVCGTGEEGKGAVNNAKQPMARWTAT